MFKKILIKNFKSFAHLDFDLVSQGKPKNIVAIYGENGSGKTNLVDVFKLLRLSLDTMSVSKKLAELQAELQTVEGQKVLPDLSVLSDFLLRSNASFRGISKNTQRISAEDATKIVFELSIGSKGGRYSLEYDIQGELISEELEYIINTNVGTHFKIYRDNRLSSYLNKSIFKKSILKDLEEQIAKFWGKHTFLSIFNNYINLLNSEYISDNVSNNFVDIISEFEKISIWTKDMRGPFDSDSLILNQLDKGEIHTRDREKLFRTEKIIYEYLSSMYIDIKDVRYRIEEEENDIKYELMVYKNVGGELIEIPVKLESHGTKNLLELLSVFLWAVDGRICIVDEIDTGIHDILMNNILRSLSDCVKGQLIFTTHDTALLKELSPSSAYFMSVDIKGNKKIKSGNEADRKVSPNNNMEKLYLEGFFGAVPEPLDIDFSELFLKDTACEE